MRTHPFLASMIAPALHSGVDSFHDIQRLHAADLESDMVPLHFMIAGPPAVGMSFYTQHIPLVRFDFDDKGRILDRNGVRIDQPLFEAPTMAHNTQWHSRLSIQSREIDESDMPPLEELDDSVVIESPIEEVD